MTTTTYPTTGESLSVSRRAALRCIHAPFHYRWVLLPALQVRRLPLWSEVTVAPAMSDTS